LPGSRPFELILAGAKAGEERAWTELYRQLGPGLLRYLSATATPSPEDTAAEVWAELARGIARFSGGEDELRAWAFATARRRRTDAWRRSGRQALSEQLVTDSLVPAPPEPGDVAGAIRFVRATLAPDQAEAVLLRFVADLSVAGTAAVMARSEGAVRTLAHRGLERLAAALAEGGKQGVTEGGWPTMVGRHERHLA
jgi:RNA polymerase sigma-70 factor (ECF subfamily)